MQSSQWHCPDCKRKLFVTDSARYWCSTCQAEKDPAQVDPCGRDFVRNQIVVNYAVEQALYRMGEVS